MKEIELRLALVFYGGVSLAIYMHGVSREVLNLVRASARRDERGLLNDTAGSTARAVSGPEQAWGALLGHLGRNVNVRVVTDVIAGASAGGVNGIMLARALAHDLPLEGHRDLWLKYADVTELARPQAGISRYLKSSLSPVLDRLISARLKKGIQEPETQEKLRILMQSRWFQPPFSGSRYIGWMLDACEEMDKAYCDGASLIPVGQSLDLFVTLTDYAGQIRRIRTDDPAFVEEWDHRRVLKFRTRHRTPKVLQSQLAPDNVPELVFSARATSSFPGAFPPASVGEMDRVLAGRKEGWPKRDLFLNNAMGLSGDGAKRRYFVDGSVVMNKPLAPVIEQIRSRPAAREVARRLVYVDPVPKAAPDEDPNASSQMPGFFKVILASLAHIPRNEPVGDDLKEIEGHNRRGRWLAQTIVAADPVVERTVRKILPGWGKVRADRLTRYRTQANAAAHEQAGYAYLTYQALKLHAVSDRLETLMSGFLGQSAETATPDWLVQELGHLVEREANSGEAASARGSAMPANFLIAHDVDYRIRRLRFAIRRLNSFYDREDVRSVAGLTEHLDHLKRLLYEEIDRMLGAWELETFTSGISSTGDSGGSGDSIAELLRQAQKMPEAAGDARRDKVREVLKRVETVQALRENDRRVDLLFAETAAGLLPTSLWRELLRAYIGFAFYDLTIFPVLQSNDFSEVSEILVDRISPRDCQTFNDEEVQLKGASLNSFGAFFNREWREHDYLWGRLNAAERLVKIVVSAAGQPSVSEDPVLAQHLENLFLAILEEEEPVLSADPLLTARIRQGLKIGS
ncbi:patatin-like protein [Roseibium sp. CAU 1637]|uniref:Patatin-like protein n=1 Tax=Roseibium limicola TaxID=2816037 RepID=A0A939ELT4_9HYPH|nr:patatin-like protein [Roseibium limicola]MBO0344803.1 patatin-like protein [Roseibium limicola]